MVPSTPKFSTPGAIPGSLAVNLPHYSHHDLADVMSTPSPYKPMSKASDLNKPPSPFSDDPMGASATPLPIPAAKPVPVKTKPSEAQLKLEEKVRSEILPPDSFLSFDEFPYYLDPTLKRLLVSSAYIFMERPEFEAYTKEIPTLSRRILLSGEPGVNA